MHHDIKLPELSIVLDEQKMASRFAKLLTADSSEPPWSALKCSIEYVHHRQGKHCQILYRITGMDAYDNPIDQWFSGKLCRQGKAHLGFSKQRMKDFMPVRVGVKEAAPVDLIDELNLIIWAFPYDPIMRTLPHAVDTETVRRNIEVNLPLFGIPQEEEDLGEPKWRCGDISYDKVKYMPRKRCVLRFHATLQGPQNHTKKITFYSKTFQDGMSKYHFGMLNSAYTHLARQAPAFNTPKPLVHLDEYHTFWQEEWPGRPLDEVLSELDWRRVFPQIAEMIAALHQSRIPNLRPGPDQEEMQIAAMKNAKRFTNVVPKFKEQIHRVLHALQENQDIFKGQDSPVTPVHGTCRLYQMLSGGDDFALIDFDGLQAGDPLLDIAEFIASLEYMEIRDGLSRDYLVAAGDLFLESYERRVAWTCDYRRIAWYVLAITIHKMWSTIKHAGLLAPNMFGAANERICDRWLEVLQTGKPVHILT